MSESQNQQRKPFRRFFYRGYEVEQLLDLTQNELVDLLHARARRRLKRGRVPMHLVRRLRKSKKLAAEGQKTDIVKTHLRSMIVLPEMVGSTVGVYNGVGFLMVEIKTHMIGHYLGEFAITYKPVRHGRPGLGGMGMAKFIPLK